MGVKKQLLVPRPVCMSKEHVVNCRCGLMGGATHVNRITICSSLGQCCSILSQGKSFFAVFDRPVPDKTHVVAYNSSSGYFCADRGTDGQTDKTITYTPCACTRGKLLL